MEFSEEELRNMPPEQVADLQKKNCIFCHIVSGRVASKKVYEDDKCLGILDINPANPGHVLLLPKEHYAIMPLVPEDVIAHMFTVAKHISQAQLRALKAQGTTIMAANGMVAGQRAPHFMIHIIPRKEGDGVGFGYLAKPVSEEDLKKLVFAIKKRANILLGLEAKEPLDLNAKPAKIKAETVQAEFEEERQPKPEARQKEQAAEPEEEPEAASEAEEEEAKLEPKPSPRPKKAATKKSEPATEPKKQSPKQKKSPSPKENTKEAPTDPDLDLISRLF